MPALVAVAVKVTAVPLHTVVLLAAIDSVGATTAFTVMVTALDVTLAGVAQADDEVNTQVTTALLAKLVELNVGLLVPTLPPFTFHWYAGVLPPPVIVAVKLTAVPAHTVVVLALIVTVGVALVPTDTAMALEVTTNGDAHSADEVSWHVTTSLLANVVVLNVALLLPTLLPFTFHW